MMKSKANWRFVLPGVASAIILAGSWMLAHLRKQGPECLFRRMTGLPCPGCGMTRSLEEIWRGNLPLSIRYHPLGIPVFILCLAGVFTLFFPRLFHRLHWTKVSFRIPLMLLSIVMAVWILRIALLFDHSTYFLW